MVRSFSESGSTLDNMKRSNLNNISTPSFSSTILRPESEINKPRYQYQNWVTGSRSCQIYFTIQDLLNLLTALYISVSVPDKDKTYNWIWKRRLFVIYFAVCPYFAFFPHSALTWLYVILCTESLYQSPFALQWHHLSHTSILFCSYIASLEEYQHVQSSNI